MTPAALPAAAAGEYLAFSQRLADAAAAATLPLFRRPLPVEAKADASPFTQADCGAEKAMCALIGEHYPAHGIIGEEFGATAADAEFVWVLDPIDGTRSFISGSPLYSTLIALLHGGVPAVSVVDYPALRERFSALHTQERSEAQFNGAPCRCADAVPPLAQAVAATTTVAVQPGADDERLQKFLSACGQVRLGGDSLAYAGVAAGWCHLAVDHLMQPYDYLPLLPLVAAAGGCMTDWRGSALAPFDGGGDSGSKTVLASASAALHEEALAALAAA